jgi:hypothetical protein
MLRFTGFLVALMYIAITFATAAMEHTTPKSFDRSMHSKVLKLAIS